MLFLDLAKSKPVVGKKVSIILIFLLLACLAVLFYYFQQSRKALFTDPYKAVSKDAGVVIETIDLQSFLNSVSTGKGLFGEMGNIKELESFNHKLKYVADQLNKSALNGLETDGPAIIALYFSGKGETDLLLSKTISGETRTRHIKDMLKNIGVSEIVTATRHDNTVLKLPYKTGSRNDTVYISVASGLILCSTSADILREAMAQSGKSDDVRNMPGFSRVLVASGKNEDKIFVVFENLGPLLRNIFTDDGNEIAGKISKLAGTGSGDIYINEDGLALSGYTETRDSLDLFSRYRYIQPVSLQTYKILPSSTVLFETLLIPGDDDETGSRNVGLINQKSGLADKLREYLGNEVTSAYIDIRGNPVTENSLIIYKLANPVEAEKLFVRCWQSC